MSDEILTDEQIRHLTTYPTVDLSTVEVADSHIAANAEIARLRSELAEKERALLACSNMAVQHVPYSQELPGEDLEDDADYMICVLCGNYWPDGAAEKHTDDCGLAALASGGEQGQGEAGTEPDTVATPVVRGSAGQPASPASPVCRWRKVGVTAEGVTINDTECGGRGFGLDPAGNCWCGLPIVTDREEG